MAVWDKLGSSGEVDDRRSTPGGRLAFGGGITGLVVTAAILLLSGQSGSQVLEAVLGQALQQPTSQQAALPAGDDYRAFAEKVLGSTNDYWTNVYRAKDQSYSPPNFVLFRSATSSGCGYASSDVGPHYCPADKTVYLDETFFDDIHRSLNANTGDVAQAYVIAHEVGHHIQNLDGTAQRQSDSVKLELQADCYAGAWANSIKNIFENEAEINEALSLASAIGDDRLQTQAGQQVNAETWTHGSSQQRTQWFTTGYSSGDPARCQP